VDNEERHFVLNNHQSLAEGTHSDQFRIGAVQAVHFTDVQLAEDGLSARTTLLLDDFAVPHVSISRDEAGKAKFRLPSISFRIMTYRGYFLPLNVEDAIRQLADQILPPAKPLGRNPDTGKVITAHNPAQDRISSEDLARAKERISSGAIGMGVTP
jgi:hypothetical protein